MANKRKRLDAATAPPVPKFAKRVPSTAAQQARSRLSHPEGMFTVRWTHFDYDGPWCLGKSSPAEIVNLMKRLRDFERMHPNEVFNGAQPLGKTYNQVDLIDEALTRLDELEFGDQTEISRLRITGPSRFYGYQRDLIFYAVFWDPEHEICPSKKKHT